jgi:hypothetical protein
MVASMALTVLPLAGEVINLGADRDNTLYVSDSGALSNGAGEHFFAGLTLSGQSRRGLLRFDLTAVPPGSTINSVVLTLNMSRTLVGPTPVSLHRLAADWGEGASDAEGEEGMGAPAEPGDATWLHTFFDTAVWATPGGDFAPAASATTMVDAEGPYSWGTSAGMEADVATWVDDPGQNFGWLVMGDEGEQPTAKRFDTREIQGLGTLAPLLVVDFTLPVPVELQSVDIE